MVKKSSSHAATLVESVNDMDDLVMQFDGTEAGCRFLEAWKRTRIIVDTGGGHTPATPPTPPPGTKP